MHRAPIRLYKSISATAFTLRPLCQSAFGRQVIGSCAVGGTQSYDSPLHLVGCGHRQGLDSPCRAAEMENCAGLWEPWVGLRVLLCEVTLRLHLVVGCYLPVLFAVRSVGPFWKLFRLGTWATPRLVLSLRGPCLAVPIVA
jgi:hypothetical protein